MKNVKKAGMFFCRLGFWFILCFFLGGSDASIKTYYVDEVCSGTSSAVVNMGDEPSGILISRDVRTAGMCEILLRPKVSWSIVLSLPKFSVNYGEELILEDSDKFKVQLLGSGYFFSGVKCILFEGNLIIHYRWDDGRGGRPLDGIKLRFVFTQTHNSPCNSDEFECRNRRCIKRDLLCDTYNNCGDMSDEDDVCESPVTEDKDLIPYDTDGPKAFVIIAILGGVTVVIIILGLVAFFIRRTVLKKRRARN